MAQGLPPPDEKLGGLEFNTFNVGLKEELLMTTASFWGLFVICNTLSCHAVLRNKIQGILEKIEDWKNFGIEEKEYVLFMQRKNIERISGTMSLPHIPI